MYPGGGITAAAARHPKIVEPIIEEMRANEFLWYKKDPNYRNKRKKERTLQKISTKLKAPIPRILKTITYVKHEYLRYRRKLEMAKQSGRAAALKKVKKMKWCDKCGFMDKLLNMKQQKCNTAEAVADEVDEETNMSAVDNLKDEFDETDNEDDDESVEATRPIQINEDEIFAEEIQVDRSDSTLKESELQGPSAQIEMIIEEMRQHEIIWYNKHVDFRKPHKKYARLEEIAQRHNLPVNKIINLIRYVKGEYRRYIKYRAKSESLGRDVKVWKWYEKCSFLKNKIKINTVGDTDNDSLGTETFAEFFDESFDPEDYRIMEDQIKSSPIEMSPASSSDPLDTMDEAQSSNYSQKDSGLQSPVPGPSSSSSYATTTDERSKLIKNICNTVEFTVRQENASVGQLINLHCEMIKFMHEFFSK